MAPVNMKEVRGEDSQENRFLMLSEEIDSLPDIDKDFILWYLLGNYRQYVDRKLEERNYPAQGIEDYAVRRMMSDHIKWTEDIRNVLQETIF